MTVTRAQLAALAPTAKAAVLDALFEGDALNAALARFDIATPRRIAAFLAQCAHESGGFVWMAELWGPTAAQLRYEPPSEKATELGNTQPGDGRRYKGRGPIQITGRANYRRYGALLGLPLEDKPERAAEPAVGILIAAAFWGGKRLNRLADVDTEEAFRRITRKINGGLNGWPDRKRRWLAAKEIWK